MSAKKSLQKFTETEVKINNLLSLKQITENELEPLSEAEKDLLMVKINERYNELKGTERDNFLRKIEPITNEITKNQLWENNHVEITCAISNLMQECGRMPTVTQIANKTDLSRQTIHKHLKEYTNHPQFIEQMEQFKFMNSKVLAKVFKFAVNGDMRAAKLYLSAMGMYNEPAPKNTLIQNQNNYIQINGTVLSQDNLKQLNPEQLNTIEAILKAALTK
jgi:DNA-binding phage protein